MKVYVLESGGCLDGDHTIHGVFTTFEKAGEANEILDIAGIVSEVELDEFTIADFTKPFSERYRTVKV